MSIKNFASSFILIAIASLGGHVYANENGTILGYIGGGSSNGEKLKTGSNTPMSIGFMYLSPTSDSIIGLDIAGEGTSVDSYNGGFPSTQRSTSINLILGRNLGKFSDSRIDASLIIGGRDVKNNTVCPKSYLGFQCYADAKPDTSTDYAVNFGGIVTYTYQSVMVGVRATGQSTQAIIGYRF